MELWRKSLNFVYKIFKHNMTTEKPFNLYLQDSIRKNWDLEAFTDYRGATLLYRDVARRTAKLHILFQEAGIKPGDRIALCGKNCSNWATLCIAIMSYGAVIVPILHEFKPNSVHNIVNHSESKLLFAGDHVWENLNESQMPDLTGILLIDDFSIVVSRNEKLTEAREHLNELFGRRYPKDFRPCDVIYADVKADDMAMINYTSGSTGFSKGVMLPYRALINNREFAAKVIPILKAGDKMISMLPMAHMYGFAFEFFFEVTLGCHVYFLTRLPSPKVIFQAFQDIRPKMIVAVPLVIEKIIKKNVMPKLETTQMKILLKLPFVNEQINKKIREELMKSFGGNFYEIIVGGAAFNQEVENFLHSVHFPYTVGYGATECAPIICYEDWQKLVPGSCGKAAYRMEVKVLSDDPENVPGEIICRGPNVMLGYYKNEKLTAETIDSDGWMHTGDLGIIDKDGNVFIKGRCKNLILGPSGQNIYPEEIEERFNNMPCVCESVVISENQKLIVLVYPDFDEAHNMGLTDEQVAETMEQNRVELNKNLPVYEQISQVRIYNEEFEKTPKRSIKRFLYQKE